MRIRYFLSLGGALAAVAPGAAVAQSSGDILFNGLILDTCIVTVASSGTLGASADFSTLTSESAGGSRGAAAVLTTSASFNLEVDPPAAFSLAPAGGDSNVTFNALYSASGATVLGNLAAGVLSSLELGLTTVSVGAEAEKSTGFFPAGAYQLPVTIRCVAS